MRDLQHGPFVYTLRTPPTFRATDDIRAGIVYHKVLT